MNQDHGKAIARVLSTVLGKLVVANDTRTAQSGEAPPITKFHALRAPSISIYDYVERIFKYAACSSECFVLALIYVDRIIQRQGFVINSLNVHRVVITSIMLAAKFFDDHYFKNGFYAKVGGVPCNEMNSLEVEFLFLINFSLHVPPETYRKYYVELCNHASTLPGIETIPPNLVFHGKLAELRFEETGTDSTMGVLAGSTASVAGKSTEGVLGAKNNTISGVVAAQKQPVEAVNGTAGGGNAADAPWREVQAPQTGANIAMTAPQVGAEDTVMGGTDETATFGAQGQSLATAVRG